jgi:hypothetical protein
VQNTKEKQSGFASKFIKGSRSGAIPNQQKSPPFVPHGLHGLFVGLGTIHASLFVSVTLFAINSACIKNSSSGRATSTYNTEH